MNNENGKRLGYKFGLIMGTVIFACATALIISATIKLISLIF